MTLTQYTQNDGLSSYYITKIIKDRDGFLWVGTQEGLNLFDGNRFQVFSSQSPAKHKLGGSLVSDLVEDRKQGLIWVLTSNGDICAIDLNTRTIVRRLTHDQDGEALAEKWMRCLALKDDILFVAGLNAFSAYNTKTNRYVDTKHVHAQLDKLGEYNISKMLSDQQGRLWVFSEGYGVALFDEKFKTLKVFPQDKLSATKQKLLFWDAIEKDGKILLASSHGLHLFSKGTETTLPEIAHDILPDLLQHSEIRSVATGRDGELLFATPHRFFSYHFENHTLDEFEDEDLENRGLNGVFQIYFDHHTERVWAGTQSGLKSFSINSRAFTSFSKSRVGSEKMTHLYALCREKNGRVLVGAENGMFAVDPLTKAIIRLDTSSVNLMIFEDAQGEVYTSNARGLYVVRNNQLIPAHVVFPALKILESDHLNCGIQYNDTLILFSSILQKGLHVWNKKSGVVKTFHHDSPERKVDGLNVINYLHKGKGPDIFILTETSIVKFNPITEKYSWHKIAHQGSAEPYNFMDMCDVADGYWFATYGGGLIETDLNFNRKRMLSVREGLSNNCVYRVFNHQNQRVVATTNFGVSVIDLTRYEVKNYFERDGLHGNGFEQLCGFEQDDQILAGGVNGFTLIDPTLFRPNKLAPTLYLQGIEIETRSGAIDTCNLNLRQIEVPSNVLQSKISFVGLNYLNPDRVNYRYNIAELGDEWINIGSQNFVNLIGLSPGIYSLQVVAANEDGVASEPLKMSLVYLPKWYQTIWFKIALIALGIMILYGIQAYRINQLKQQQAIRKEIANDLHDDIGSTLNSLKIFSHLAHSEPENKTHITQIEESISGATQSLRDIIWVLDEDDDSVYDLTDRIKRFALPVCLANNVKLETLVEQFSQGGISKRVKRNLLLVAKEFINNSIKYAHCQNIVVAFRQDKRELTLTLSDDGVGFDFDTITPGRGLASIRYRAEQISFKCTIDSHRNGGTRVILRGKS